MPKPKLLLVCDAADADRLLALFSPSHEVVVEHDPIRALALMASECFDSVYVSSPYFQQAFQLGKLIQNEQILAALPEGILLLDHDNTIVWSNGRLCEWCHREVVVGQNFYEVLDTPEILGPDFCPFHTALATGQATASTLRTKSGQCFHIHAAPLRQDNGAPRHLLVTLRDVTLEHQQQQKFAAIHQAGSELADLSPEELLQMPVKDRVNLLKDNILHFTKDLLHFEVVEIRLIDPKTGRLVPLLEMGMEPEAAGRELYAQPQNNGVTGFVAATGKSYLCEDTTEDPLYLEGAHDAKSSLTVPLMLHDRVIGTFNVESREPRAFTENDLQFLEIFGRDVAVALNTLELLVAEKAGAAAEAVEIIHSAVALPIDIILNEAVNIGEHYIGHDPEMAERLQRILRHARDIKQLIQKVGQQMAPTEAKPDGAQAEEPSNLRGAHILVVDADESVRTASHNLLDRYGCTVETAHDGGEAMSMVRSLVDGSYDLVISDLRLPDMNAHQFMLKLQEVMEPAPLVLMTGFGWDPDHILVKCRQAGLPPNAVLFKPFRLDQLVSVVQKTIDFYQSMAPPAAVSGGE